MKKQSTNFLALIATIFILFFLSNNVSATTFTVTKVADTNDGVCDTDCSLREAITAANNVSSDDVIEFALPLFATAQTIVLNGTQLEIQNNGSLTINGTGNETGTYNQTISGNNISRVFYINPHSVATLKGFRITQGKAINSSGGAIYNDGGILTLSNNMLVDQSFSDQKGGGVYSSNILNQTSDLILSQSRVMNNSSIDGGGGIYSLTNLNMTFGAVSNNFSTGQNSVGGGIYCNSVTNLTYVNIYSNNSTQLGGGIYYEGNSLTLNSTDVTGNRSNRGGGIYTIGNTNILNSFVNGNRGTIEGGGIYKNSGTLIIESSTINQNSSPNNGGGIFNFTDALTISKTTFLNNVIQGSGAGLYIIEGGGNVKESIFESNIASVSGAGVCILGGTLDFTNTTFYQNIASDSGGGINVVSSSSVNLLNTTFTANIADFDNNGIGKGGGINNTNASVFTRNSIISNNIDNSGNGNEIYGVITSQGFNLIKNTQGFSGTITSDILNLDPEFLPISSYGGLTRTIGLKNNSPAIDAADPNNFPLVDQRGIPRPQDGDINGTTTPDIGAFERQVTIFRVTKTADTNDGICNNDCSLREAVSSVNSSTSLDNAITFDSSIFNLPQSIQLNLGNLNFTNVNSVALIGPGIELLSIDCLTNSSITTDNQANLTLSKLTITGSTSGNSVRLFNSIGSTINLDNVLIKNSASLTPALLNYGIITITNSVFSNNLGNAITSESGSKLTVINSNISNNSGIGILNRRGLLSLTGVIINNNNNTASGSGAGVSNIEGTANITNSVISNNVANGFRGSGGGIYNFSGGSSNPASLTILNSKVTGNTAIEEGGGLINILGSLTITNTTFDNNKTQTGVGGGLYIFSGTLNLNGSSVFNNIAITNGGGIYNNNAISTISNSTIYNNTAAIGGGIYSDSGNGPLTIKNSTINSNKATTRGGGIARGGGNPVILVNSILADNSDNTTTNPAPDFLGTLTSQGYNLIENTTGTTITGVTTGNILGQDPRLLPIGNYGGTTQTAALQPNSPAIDAGDPNNTQATDQRGVSRPQDGDLNGIALPDIGAYERQVNVFTVTKTADTNDGICDSDCSLREAVLAINSYNSFDNAVVFNSTFATPQTIILSNGEILIPTNKSLLINGSNPNLLTFSGNNSNRLFYVNSNSLLMINGGKLTNGNGVGAVNSGYGGSIYNEQGFVILNNSIVTSNTANTGGGIYSGVNNFGGTLHVINSTISNNISSQDGGGVVVFGEKALFENSTISGNISNNGGGGISSIGIREITVNNSEINNNSASSGGGIYCFSCGPIKVNNSLLKNNRASSRGGGVYAEAQLSINNSTISNNIATSGEGGGIYFPSSTSPFSLTNSTISNNSGVLGGGIFNDSNSTTISNSTIAFNIGAIGGGVLNSSFANLSAKNTIFANNIANTGNPDFSGTLNSQGYNLIKNTTGTTIIGTTTGNILGQDPQLLPLRNYGGLTPTHALRKTSPAIDKGSLITGITTDQRNRTRPYDFPIFTNASGGNGSDIGAFERQQFETFTEAPFDYDGDSKSDISVFRPSDGAWYMQNSTSGFYAVAFGANGDKVVPADFSGDGKTDVAVWRDGTWYVFNTTNNTFYGIPFGTTGDIPVPEDFDGDGKADINVFRPSTGMWFRNNSSNGQFVATPFGQSGDVPTVGDFDGDGKADIAVWRPSNGAWYRLNSNNGSFFAVAFGQTGDKVVPADYTGDGKTDIAVYRGGTWYILRSEDLTFYGIPFGLATDIPTAGDFDGDGKADQAVYRNGQWFIQQSTSGFLSMPFGLSGDTPTESAFVY